VPLGKNAANNDSIVTLALWAFWKCTEKILFAVIMPLEPRRDAVVGIFADANDVNSANANGA